MKEIKFDTSGERLRFKHSLDLVDNRRLILSGIFGIGKTTFLRDFFDFYNNEYLHLRINPVNYSVSSNEDIFQYIKYDIILELLLKTTPSDDYDFSKWYTAQFYVQSKTIDIAIELGQHVTKVGKKISDVYKSILRLKEDFNKFHQDINDTDYERLVNFLESINQASQTNYNINMIDELIVNAVSELTKGKNNSILVIDDLDRIDPEHIFRILNIFSSHSEYKHENKTLFGFDKVVLVCDVENVRQIFHARYGTNVDFTGYIDKFYDKEIFKLDMKSIIKSGVDQFIDSIIQPTNELNLFDISSPSSDIFKLLQNLIIEFVMSNSINLRALKRLQGMTFAFPRFDIEIIQNYVVKQIPSTKFAAIGVFNILEKLFETRYSLSKAISTLSNQIHNDKMRIEDSRYYGYLVVLAFYESLPVSHIQPDISYPLEAPNTSITFTIVNKPGSNNISGLIQSVNGINNTDRTVVFPSKQLIRDSYAKYCTLLND